MDNKKIAKELVKLAKELIARPNLAMISDLDNMEAYFIADARDAKDSIDKKVYESTTEMDDTITMGKIVGTPANYLSSDDKRNYRKHGIGKKFEI